VGYAIRERLLPVAAIATPNLPEARGLAELPEGAPDQCAEKQRPHVRHQLNASAHGDATEMRYLLHRRDGQVRTPRRARLPGSYHGSGCTLASALAGRLALGEDLPSAVQNALYYTWRCLRDAEAPGHGQYIPRRLPLDFGQ